MTGRSLFRSRHWRLLRWVGLAPAVAALWACTARSLEKPKVLPAPIYQNRFQESVNRNIDILFVIDNSLSMAPLQAHLNENFPRFMDVLENLPDGLPNVHIAVVSTDMGAGTGIQSCGGNGNAGVFQYSAHSPCTDTTLGGATYIVNDNGQANYSAPELSTVFTCIANIGDTGCGFEQPLLAASRALGGDGYQPAENAGFLRRDAYLGIIFIANEDDCSARMGAADGLFDTNQRTLGTALGPVGSYRCNEFGHLCGGASPARMGPNNQAGDTMTYNDCVSNEDSAYLKPVGQFVNEIKALKDDPASQILVAAITGVRADGSFPYTVRWETPTTADTGPWPSVGHSCEVMGSMPPEYADPPVRLAEFVRAFGENGSLYSICAQDFGPALQTIAEKLSQLIGPKCIGGTLANPTDCTVTDHFTRQGGGGTNDTVVPACEANGNTPPCWRLEPGTGANMCAPGTFVMNIERGGMMAPLNSTVSCALCAPNVNAGTDCSPATIVDPRCPCP